MAEIISDPVSGAFIEQKCCIEHGGQKFCNGGSFLAVRVNTGKMAGILYGDWSNNPKTVSSWDGSVKIPAWYGREYRNNFGAKCRYCWFKFNDRFFSGRWSGIEWSQIVRVREITEKAFYRNVPRWYTGNNNKVSS